MQQQYLKDELLTICFKSSKMRNFFSKSADVKKIRGQQPKLSTLNKSF